MSVCLYPSNFRKINELNFQNSKENKLKYIRNTSSWQQENFNDDY